MEKGQIPSFLSDLTKSIKNENLGWEVGDNFLLELPKKEQELYLGCVPGPNEPTLEESERIASTTFKAGDTSLMADQALPATFDWRNRNGKNFITPVKHQGPCGSCVAFGAVATVESRIRIIANDPNYNIDLSEAHLFYCHARSEGRNCSIGWWCDKALIAFRDKGVADEACYPYTPGDQDCTGLCSNWQGRSVKISGYTTHTDRNAMKAAIINTGPLVGRYSVYSDFFAYSSGVYRKSSGATSPSGHCISVVGYDDTNSCWICKNSWGPNWGEKHPLLTEKGYFRIGYGEVGIDERMWSVNDVPLWLHNKKVTGLWSINEVRNAWVLLHGVGWKKIWNQDDVIFYMMLTQLTSAKGSGSNVHVYLNNGMISQIYVLN
jgi:C1A family cysteine protease